MFASVSSSEMCLYPKAEILNRILPILAWLVFAPTSYAQLIDNFVGNGSYRNPFVRTYNNAESDLSTLVDRILQKSRLTLMERGMLSCLGKLL
jgi:hypothetical protein